MFKLELKHITPYLPYSLRASTRFGRGKEYCRTVTTGNIWNFVDDSTLDKIILRPLSDLGKDEYNFIYENETDFDSIESLINLDSYSFQCSKFSYIFWEKLFHYHFDVFGLIEKGFAIDINTLNI